MDQAKLFLSSFGGGGPGPGGDPGDPIGQNIGGPPMVEDLTLVV